MQRSGRGLRVVGSLALCALAAAAACSRHKTPGPTAGDAPQASATPPLPATPARAEQAPREVVPATAKVTSPCPEGMALIGDRFCIDKWEASTVNADGTPHSPYLRVKADLVKAVSLPGVVPQAYIDEQQAEWACERAGKKLCTTKQWLAACNGTDRIKRPYPYGMQRQKKLCNTERRVHPTLIVFGEPRLDSVSMNSPLLNQVPDTVAKTGEFDQCVTPEGVYDLYGNLLEWTRGGAPHPYIMGGHYLDGYKHGLGCAYVTDGHGDQYSDFTTGFRCCAKPDETRLAEYVESKQTSEAAFHTPPPPKDGSSRDPEGMRSFENALGRLPEVAPPAYDPADAFCPVDMVHVKGNRCPDVVERCKKWLPHRMAGRLTSCVEFEQTVCRSPQRHAMDYCIDKYEYTPPGYDYPLTHVNWTEAGMLCSRMDKRLCHEDEWEFACEGEDALPYPYGYTRNAKLCNHDIPEIDLVSAPDVFIDHRVKPDALPGCVSPFGVYNMVGNVDEWTTRPGGTPYPSILRGGWWFQGRNRCRAATDNHSTLYAGVQTGFRCCKAAREK